MCLYPIRIRNKKYIANKKNGGDIPSLPVLDWDTSKQIVPVLDTRVMWVDVPCGQCIECRKQKARNWQVRLLEEIKDYDYKYFVTLTFDPIQLGKLKVQTNLKECNALCSIALRRCLERYRKDYKHSLRHWFITELGHEGTKRIHMHGIIFSDQKLEFEGTEIEHFVRWKYWKYGHIYVGDYVNAKTINYIVKYVTKIDSENKGFVGQILCSPGIGKRWLEEAERSGVYTFNWKQGTMDTYITEQGAKIKLPTYYKNKLFTDREREENWRLFMDKEQQSIMGNTYSKKTTTEDTLSNITEKARETNQFLEYGDNSGEWKKKPYNVTSRMLSKTAKEELEKALERAKRHKELKKLRENGIKV